MKYLSIDMSDSMKPDWVEYDPITKKEYDNERWVDIPEYDGVYKISNLARVKSFKRKEPHIMTISRSYYHGEYQGGHVVKLSKDGTQLDKEMSRLMFNSFFNVDDFITYSFKDGDDSNYRLSNFEISTKLME